MKIKILIDLRRFFSNAQRRSLTSELSEDQNHINFPDDDILVKVLSNCPSPTHPKLKVIVDKA